MGIGSEPFEIYPFGKMPQWARIVVVLISFVLFALLLIAVSFLFVWPFALVRFWSYITSAAHSPWKRILITVGLTVLGVSLYLARSFARSLYGVAEMLAGVAFCWAGLVPPVSSGRWGPAGSIVGGIYIIVRGMDNLLLGIEERKKDTETDSDKSG